MGYNTHQPPLYKIHYNPCRTVRRWGLESASGLRPAGGWGWELGLELLHRRGLGWGLDRNHKGTHNRTNNCLGWNLCTHSPAKKRRTDNYFFCKKPHSSKNIDHNHNCCNRSNSTHTSHRSLLHPNQYPSLHSRNHGNDTFHICNLARRIRSCKRRQEPANQRPALLLE